MPAKEIPQNSKSFKIEKLISKSIPGRKDISEMAKALAVAATLIILLGPVLAGAQQKYRLPDFKSMKHITTKNSDHAPDIPGKETTMDYYSSQNGDVVTVYSYKGRTVAFSTHSNKDVQGSYRVFMDLTGEGFFQEINRGVQWQLPAWVR